MEAVVVYVGGVLLSGKPIFLCIPWFFDSIGPFMILLLDVIWIIWMKKSKAKSVQKKVIKKISSVFVFALSASLLTLWLIFFLWNRHQW